MLSGTRFLILGESHYTTEPAKIGTTPSGFTRWVVEEFALEAS